MFVPGRPFHPSLMFVVKARAYLSEALFRYSTLGWAPGLTHRHHTRLEMLFGDKHSSILRKIKNHKLRTKKFYNNGARTGFFTSRPTSKYMERYTNAFLQVAKQVNLFFGQTCKTIFWPNRLIYYLAKQFNHRAV